MAVTRREFFKRTGYALGATAFVSQFGLLSALAQGVGGGTDYKALVCIFMSGGNDAFNMVVPTQADQYGLYASARPAIALPQSQLLPINPLSAGQPFGLHPSLTELQALWGAQKTAILCNVGTLVAPTTPSEYRSNPAVRPTSLFDHYSQQNTWQNLGSPEGWGQAIGYYAKSLNTSPRLPMLINVTGSAAIYLAGTDPFITLAPGATLSLQGFTSSSASTARYQALRQMQMLSDNAALVNVISDNASKTIDDAQLTSQVLGGANVATVFPKSSLGQQLLQIAKIISVRASLGQNRRQIFFANIGSFDTHAGQLVSHAALLRDLSQSVNAFYNATVELGVSSDVTSFTLSEFGRTFQNAIDGTDHAWGSHSLITGDAVLGGDFYGQYPSIVLGGANDVDTGASARGRFLPTTSVDQYAATLGSWFGLDSTSLQTALPNLYRFAPQNLGFMQAG